MLDTNILIDYLGRRESFFVQAERIVAAGFFGNVTLWMAAQSPKDACYVLERYTSSQRIQQALLETCHIITPVALTADDLTRAARLQWDDYRDCLVAIAAQKAGADYLITRDAKGFDRSMVPTISPAA
ncbi:type II toxin-antitoxin system VapC family toxin [Adlercreutzia mucosicola]|uniref:type II toxin-antitoxin system VapC family toxin n=2 Tax=Adlercreutzia mucosicola TaxID=580026 RepID=UPI00136560F3|nr:PIN domain-containing protein [Adlercreutzia mucosicola]MEB1813698.1 PIN domain-containing protein [Adlercreutzia mucosicola]